MELSIVTTLYYSAPYLAEFYTRIKEEAQKITENYEIILVNDGSPDDSLDIAISLYEHDDRVRVVDLSRNFGQQRAIMTGLARARGALVFLIDCDLELDPELLGQFYSEWCRTGADVIYGVQKTRKGGLFERVSGFILYKLLNFLFRIRIPHNITTAQFMSERYVTSLLRHKESAGFLPGLFVLTGFQQITMFVKKHNRDSSTYTLSKKISTVVNAITSFSEKPLIYIFYLGSAILTITVPYLVYLVATAFYFDLPLGWTSVIASVWFFGGLVIFALGIIGIYLARIFLETKNRPYTIIRELYDRGDPINGATLKPPVPEAEIGRETIMTVTAS